jgi:hypothetical protein
VAEIANLTTRGRQVRFLRLAIFWGPIDAAFDYHILPTANFTPYLDSHDSDSGMAGNDPEACPEEGKTKIEA